MNKNYYQQNRSNSGCFERKARLGEIMQDIVGCYLRAISHRRENKNPSPRPAITRNVLKLIPLQDSKEKLKNQHFHRFLVSLIPLRNPGFLHFLGVTVFHSSFTAEKPLTRRYKDTLFCHMDPSPISTGLPISSIFPVSRQENKSRFDPFPTSQ